MTRGSLLGMFSSNLAIDLGTANTLVYATGKGIVVDEPSIVALNKKTGQVESVGKDAKEMLGRTPEYMVAVQPMQDGVIADFDAAERMLRYFIKKAHRRKRLVHPRIIIGVPSETTDVERRAVLDAGYRAKASEVYLVDQAMVAAIGAGLPVTEATGSMVVDIGGGTTDIAVISLAGIVYSRSVRVAGNLMDEKIIEHLRQEHNLVIGERTAETIKTEVGSAYPLDRPSSMEVKGRDVLKGTPRTVSVRDEEIRQALSGCVSSIVQAIRVALERIPPELSADISDRGIALTGGGSLLKNLDKRIRTDTSLPVSLAENPLTSVVMGTAKTLEDFTLLRRLSIPTLN
jgi:rod shape-determining protein MreB and related proteins